MTQPTRKQRQPKTIRRQKEPQSNTPAVTPHSIIDLQAMIGNQGVQTLLAQRKVTMSGTSVHLTPQQIQRALVSPRFASEEALQAASENRPAIRFGATGTHVTRIQQALVDLGYELPRFGVDGEYGAETRAAVRQFQVDKGLAQDGVVGRETMNCLDQLYQTYQTEADVAQGQVPSTPPSNTEWALGTAPAELTEGTRTLSDGDRAAVDEAISTEQTVDPDTGLPPVFSPDAPAPGYEARIRQKLHEVIDWQYNEMGRGKAALRSDPANLHDWSRLEAVSLRAKQEVDKIFGNYAVRPALREGVNLFDRWETEETQINADPAYADSMAQWRVNKILTGDDDIKAIDREHGAIQSRAAEEAIITRIRDDAVSRRRDELLEIHKGWPAAAGNGEVYLQRFRSPDAEVNREFMWEVFGTIIHEYIHLLEHSNHVRYREGLPEQRGGFTLREGVTDYFSKTVWENVDFNDATLRSEVEGPYHDPTAANEVGDPSRYGEAVNAESMAGVVGIRNVMAAFFLGRVDLIGGPASTP